MGGGKETQHTIKGMKKEKRCTHENGVSRAEQTLTSSSVSDWNNDKEARVAKGGGGEGEKRNNRFIPPKMKVSGGGEGARGGISSNDLEQEFA